jgi:hypothetical protein
VVAGALGARPTVELDVVRGTLHTQQLLAGFLMLERAGELDLNVRLVRPSREAWPLIVTATIDGRRVGYDVRDGIIDLRPTVRRYLDSLDHFFVRSYRAGVYGAYESRVRPLGLNYDVAICHPTSLAARYATARGVARAATKVALRYDRLPFVTAYEQAPRDWRDGPVLFLTRCWDLDEHKEAEGLESVAAVNASRAQVVRTLRAAFGRRFIGGFQPTPYARANFPDCVIDARIARRRRYLDLMKQASVCVTTRGLHQSNGWKLAEYVAASKPIATEPLFYDVPGGFGPGTNYVEFRNPDELVAAVQELVADRSKAACVAHANHLYYMAAVRPDALVRNSLIASSVLRDRRVVAHAAEA